VASFSVVVDALVIDLAAMRRIVIDPASRTARVRAGATSAELASAAQEHGLALSTGDTPTVGMGGLTTGGGIGFMVRRYGLAIDNLLSARIVTASGEIVTASPTSHPDLFWAIRGGGGNVGIVTEFEFRMAPVGTVLGGTLMLPATREVVRGYLDFSVSAPDDLTTIGNMMPAPPAPFVPDGMVSKPMLMILLVGTGDVGAGQKALAPLRALAEPTADLTGPMPYPSICATTRRQGRMSGARARCE